MKKGPLKLSLTLIILLIVTILFKDKYIYLAPSLGVSISSFTYAFTFLIPVIIVNNHKFKEAKDIITLSTLGILIFLLLITILSSISGNLESIAIEDSLRNILTPNSLVINRFIIHYPNLNILGMILTYYFSHNILISVYEALNYYTNNYLSYSLSIFIAFIIDTMFMVPLSHIKDIYYANIDILTIIKSLTANFMVVIGTSLFMILIFSIYINAKQKKNN